MSDPLAKWRWIVLGVCLAPFVGMVLYPPWMCATGGAGYQAAPGAFAPQPRTSAVRDDFPPNRPMAYCPPVQQTVVHAWLFAPPHTVGGRRCSAELHWPQLGPWLTGGGGVLLALLLLLRPRGGISRFLSARLSATPPDSP